MKRPLAGLLMLAGCSAETFDVTEPQEITVQDAATIDGDETETSAEKDASLRDEFGKQLDDATPFSETLSEKYGIGRKGPESTVQQGAKPSEKQSDEAGKQIVK